MIIVKPLIMISTSKLTAMIKTIPILKKQWKITLTISEENDSHINNNND